MTFTMNPFHKKTVQAFFVAAAGVFPTASTAQDVTLKSPDGTVNIIGEFIDYTDGHYVIRTGLGDLRIAGSRVNCEGAACPILDGRNANLKIAGSDDIGLGLMPLLMSGYASHLGAEAKIDTTDDGAKVLGQLIGDGGFGDQIGSYSVSSTSSSDAFLALLDKSASLGMSSRRIFPAEARELRDNGAGNMVSPAQEHIVAIDSLVLVAHPDNPVDQLTVAQLRDVYSGNIVNWSELGGADVPITMIGRPEGSGNRDLFEARMFGGDPVALSASATIAEDNNAVAKLVNSEPGALGYVGYAFQRGAKPLSLVSECGIRATPDAFSAKTEEYALQRRLYFYTREDTADDSVGNFLDYVTSPRADPVISKAGFISLGILSQEQSPEGDRAKSLSDTSVDQFEGAVMGEMIEAMAEYDRLSTTFRFNTGSSRMDERGVADMARLASHLETQPEGTKVLFVGFTDSVGAFASNRTLSEGRAGDVQQAVNDFAGARLAHVEMAHTGFGEIAPSACNTTEGGRSMNRRVEVWIGKDTQS